MIENEGRSRLSFIGQVLASEKQPERTIGTSSLLGEILNFGDRAESLTSSSIPMSADLDGVPANSRANDSKREAARSCEAIDWNDENEDYGDVNKSERERSG